MINILLIVAILFQTIATIIALRLLRQTKYNVIWIMFVLGFTMLSIERYLQIISFNGREVPSHLFYFTGFVVSIGLALGVFYVWKLLSYIERLDRNRTQVSKRILSAVIRTEEKFRSRFSKDLHDGLGPLLSSVKISLSAIEHAKDEAQREKLIKDSIYVIDESIRSLREISNNLSPHVLNDFGLKRGVAHFINKGVALNGVKVDYQTNIGTQRYNSDLEVILYRVVCELINNSIKHAHCSNIMLSIQQIDNYLTLNYSDDGCGFNPKAMIDCGMGLSNISSRINTINGTFEISSRAGEGMAVSVKLKLN
ncbi:MAG: ATP-binding protein [Rikenellaceae bacterium]